MTHKLLVSPLPGSLDTKEAWRQFVYAPPMEQPPRLTLAEIGSLTPRDTKAYNANRCLWHAHYGLFKTRQVKAVQNEIATILDANQHPIGRARTSILVEADSGLGKTSLIDDLLRTRHKEICDLKGNLTDAGDDRHPVLRISVVGGKITFLGFMKRVARFYAVPGRGRPSQSGLFDSCLTHLVDCETEAVYIDEVQNLPWTQRTRDTTREFLRALSNQARVTIIYAGVGLSDTAFWGDTDSQQRRRTINALSLSAYNPFVDEVSRREWIAILKRLEQRLLLPNHQPGTFESLADYIWARTRGNLKSLDTLYLIASAVAIRTGREALTEELFETIQTDFATQEHVIDHRVEAKNLAEKTQPARRRATDD